MAGGDAEDQMSKQIEALKLALEAMEDMLSGDLTPYQASKTITSIKKALADQPAQPSKPLTDEQQIAEALRRHGLTLVKTANGYDVIKLGQIIANGIKGNT